MKKRTARCTPYKWRYGILHSRILRFSFFGVESGIDLSTFVRLSKHLPRYIMTFEP